MEFLVYLERGWLKIGSRKPAGTHGAVRCSDLAVYELIMILPTRGHVRSVCSAQDEVGTVLINNCI